MTRMLIGVTLCVARSAYAQEDVPPAAPAEDICYQGWHEVPTAVVGMRCCEPIPADSEQCEERTMIECTIGEIMIGSHLIACGREVRIHNERCAATVAAYSAQQEVVRLCNAIPFYNAEGCADAKTTLRAALEQKRRVFE